MGLGLKVDSINIDATRCMPDKERGGSANAVSVFLDVKERGGRRRRIEKRKVKDKTMSCTREKKEKKP